MDDMKRLIEKYKQELMEYSRAAAPKAEEPPKMPEITPKPEETQADMREKYREDLFSYFPETEPSKAEETPQPEPEETVTAAPEETVITAAKETIIPAPEEAPEETPAEEVPMQDGYNSPLTGALPPSEDTYAQDGYMSPEERNAANKGAEDAPRKPQVIGYVDSAGSDERDILSAYDSLFSDMMTASGSESQPSFQETQQDITDSSVPKNNVPPRKPVSGVTDNAGLEPLPDTPPSDSGSAEQAERLTEQPISGQYPEEQLTGRTFEDNRTPAGNPADILPLENEGVPFTGFPVQEYASYEEFAAANPRQGTMQFAIFTARGALPVEGAECRITKRFSGVEQTLYTLFTNSSGKSAVVSLPAPPKELSQSSGNTIQPFSLYDASIRAKGYADVILTNIPVFEGVLSLQRTAMVPDTGGASQVIDESEQAMRGGV